MLGLMHRTYLHLCHIYSIEFGVKGIERSTPNRCLMISCSSSAVPTSTNEDLQTERHGSALIPYGIEEVLLSKCKLV